MADITIPAGVTSSDLSIEAGDNLYIQSGGSAIRTNVYTSGGMYVYEDAAAGSTTVNDGGLMHISGGTATGNTVNTGGEMHIFYAGAANDTTVNSGGFVALSGGIANGVTVNDGGRLWGYSGTTLNGAAVNSGGYVGISSGCTAANVVENGGYVYIPDEWEGGQADVTFQPNSFSGLALNGTWATVHSGTTATAATVNTSGLFHILSGGIADSATINPGGKMEINGGSANDITVNTGGLLWVYTGGIADGVTVNPGGEVDIFNAGTLNNAVVNSEGGLAVYEGTANGVTVSGGVMVTYATGIVNSAAIKAGGQMHIMGTVNSATLSEGGYAGLSGGIMAHVTIDDGTLWVTGGTASDIAANSGGFLGVSSGGSAMDIVENGGFVLLQDEAYASFKPNSFSGLVLNQVWTTLHSGTTATDTTVNSGGFIQVLPGGLANNTTVNAGGAFQLNTNGTALDATFNSGCQVELVTGGKLTGKITFESGAVVSAMSDTILDFNLTRTSAGAAALVNDLSFIPNSAIFALTVDGTEADGTYHLADGAAGFEAMIYVINPDWSMILSVLTPGASTVIGTSRYTLTLTDDALAVTVSFVVPDDVYVNNEWAGLPDGTIVAPVSGGTVAAAIGYDAFADVNDAFAAVSEDGEVHVVGGSVSFNGAVDRAVLIGKDVTLTGKASFNRHITLDGTIVFDTENAVGSPQFTGFDGLEPGDDAKFTLTASPGALGTSVTLATGASVLLKREVHADDFDFVVGAPDFQVIQVDGKKASRFLDLDRDQDLVLSCVACENRSDGDVKNGCLVKKKTVNPHIGELQSNRVDKFSRVLLDDKGTVLENGNYNFLGGDDKADYAKIMTDCAAKLCFSVTTKNADDKVKLSLVSFDAATGTTKTLKSVTASKGREAYTAALFVDPNDPKNAGLQYFAGVENKGKTEVFYNVAVTTESDFFVDADNGWNNCLIEKKVLNPHITDFHRNDLTEAKSAIQLETDDFVVAGHGDLINWVGFGDDTDIARISFLPSEDSPDAPAALNFTLTGSSGGGVPASLKLIVRSLTWDDRKKTYVTKTVSSKTLNLKKAAVVSTGELKLDRLDATGDTQGLTGYYVSVQNTNAKVGGEAYYKITTAGAIYADADYSVVNVSGNGWLFNKKDNTVNGDLEKADVEPSGQSEVVLDSDVSHGDYENFVGFGDVYDYAELIVSADGLYNFSIDTTGKAKFSVYSMTRKNGKWTQKTLGSLTIRDVIGATGLTLKKNVQLTAATENVRYFVSMQATDTKKCASVYYNVAAVPVVVANVSALAMPETSDSLAMTDDLSFGQCDADALASASASFLAELDDKAVWQSLALA